jgi:hypothetical protein
MTRHLCRYCRQASDPGQAVSCPWCGAPIDIRLKASESGWMEQPAIPSMSRLSCGKIKCQITGSYVPAAEFGLPADEWIYFSPQVLLWADAATALTPPSRGDGGMMKACGPGYVGVSENRAGELIAVPLQRRRTICVRQGRSCARPEAFITDGSVPTSVTCRPRVWIRSPSIRWGAIT